MKKIDLVFIPILLMMVLPFMPLPCFSVFQTSFLYNEGFWVMTSFLKFALLATMGECIGLRIKQGKYYYSGFGLIPRMIVWGFLGILIKIAFVVFAAGTPVVVEKYFGVSGALDSMKKEHLWAAMESGMGFARIITAFCISAVMNLTFAPVFMTFHKITDTHIIENGGTLSGFFRWMKIKDIFPRMNWSVQWDFVFKRTIPFFWIPAHTITFLMAAQYRVVFAAFLGIFLGIFMALANQKEKK